MAANRSTTIFVFRRNDCKMSRTLNFCTRSSTPFHSCNQFIFVLFCIFQRVMQFFLIFLNLFRLHCDRNTINFMKNFNRINKRNTYLYVVSIGSIHVNVYIVHQYTRFICFICELASFVWFSKCQMNNDATNTFIFNNIWFVWHQCVACVRDRERCACVINYVYVHCTPKTQTGAPSMRSSMTWNDRKDKNGLQKSFALFNDNQYVYHIHNRYIHIYSYIIQSHSVMPYLV